MMVKDKHGAKFHDTVNLIKKMMKVEDKHFALYHKEVKSDKHSALYHKEVKSVKIIMKAVNGSTAPSQKVMHSKKIMVK